MRTLASAREEEGAGVEEWEELLHPGPQEAFYPTLPHDATPIPHFAPPSDHEATSDGPDPASHGPFRRGGAGGGPPSSRPPARCSAASRNTDCGGGAIPSVTCACGGSWW